MNQNRVNYNQIEISKVFDEHRHCEEDKSVSEKWV